MLKRDFAYADIRPQMSTPLDYVFYLAIATNIFSVFGFVGILNQQRELVTAFFVYSAVQMVATFHFFVDAVADVGIRFEGGGAGGKDSLVGYERAVAGASLHFPGIVAAVCDHAHGAD